MKYGKVMKKILEILSPFIKVAIGYSAILGLLSLLNGLEFLNFMTSPIFVHCVIIFSLGLIYLYHFEKNIESIKNTFRIVFMSTSLSIAIKKETNLLLKKKQYYSIIRLRGALSRYFWLEGKLAERISLGEAANEAASAVGDIVSQTACLIDDIGWTKVVAKDYQGAKISINHGLNKAIALNEYYWIAKAHRHLAGIYALEGNQSESTIQMNKAKKQAELIQTESEKKEVLAGIESANVMNLIVIGDQGLLPEMRASIALAQNIYEELNDKTRLIRLHALRGKIALAQGLHLEAKDCFHIGLRESEDLGRKDEMIRNLYGLANVYALLHEQEKAGKYADRAKKLNLETPVPFELYELVKS